MYIEVPMAGFCPLPSRRGGSAEGRFHFGEGSCRLCCWCFTIWLTNNWVVQISLFKNNIFLLPCFSFLFLNLHDRHQKWNQGIPKVSEFHHVSNSTKVDPKRSPKTTEMLQRANKSNQNKATRIQKWAKVAPNSSLGTLHTCTFYAG